MRNEIVGETQRPRKRPVSEIAPSSSDGGFVHGLKVLKSDKTGGGPTRVPHVTLAADDAVRISSDSLKGIEGSEPSSLLLQHVESSSIATAAAACKKGSEKVTSIDQYFVFRNEGLHTMQAAALQAVKSGKNVFLTGPARSGKKVALQHILKHLSETLPPDQWVALSPIASRATSIEAQTVSSFACIGVPVVAKDFNKAWNNFNQESWPKLKVMVIEETNMISGEYFDRISDVICDIRGDHSKAFGGIQLVVCGDFFQLTPGHRPALGVGVDINTMLSAGVPRKNIYGARGLAFQSKAWVQANFIMVDLKEGSCPCHSKYEEVLRELRRGIVSDESAAFLKKCDRPLVSDTGIIATRLYITQCDVTTGNIRELAKISTPLHTYQARDMVEPDSNAPSYAEEKMWRNEFFHNCIAEKELSLKVGAQVMLIKKENNNREKRFSSGTRGIVIGFTYEKPDEAFHNAALFAKSCKAGEEPNKLFPKVRFLDGSEKVIGYMPFSSRVAGQGVCIRIAVPLALAWKTHLGKTHGVVLDFVKVDLSDVLHKAKAYVALSRASDENGLELRNFSPGNIRADKRALQFYNDPNAEVQFWDHEDLKLHNSVSTSSL